MPTSGNVALDIVISVGLTAVGLFVAKLFRCIEFENFGAAIGALLGLILVRWVAPSLVSFLFSDGFGPNVTGWTLIGRVYFLWFVINTVAVGLTSLFVPGFKVRGFLGLVAAGLVVTVAENIEAIVQFSSIGRT